MNLQKIFWFIKFLNKFSLVKRYHYVNGEDRLENDTEHSYHLTMLAWYIIDSYKLNLDKNLVIKYALVHDLVETYAWDTFIYEQDKNIKESKSQREHNAMVKIGNEFMEFNDMNYFIESYEKKEDIESKFVYALDKIMDPLKSYIDGGRLWKNVDLTKVIITIEMLRENKDHKIKQYPDLYNLWLEFIQILENNRKDLFLK